MTRNGLCGLVAVHVLVAILAAGCGGATSSGSVKEGSPMRLTSPAFADDTTMPATFTRDGEDLSPPLVWADAPDGTRSFVIACVDRHPLANGWVHWLVVDIPADVSSLPAGASGQAMPPGATELGNTYGAAAWNGPAPPKGTGAHDYEFEVHALDIDTLGVGDGADYAEVASAMKGHTLASGSLTGIYER